MSSRNEVFAQPIEQMFEMVNRGTMRAAKTPQEDGAPGIIVPFAFNGSGVFDQVTYMHTLVWVPDVMISILKAQMVVSVREFFAPATTASSGGGSTSGSAGAIGVTSAGGGGHSHEMFRYLDNIPGAATERDFQARDAGGTPIQMTLKSTPAGSLYTYGAEAAHTHSVTPSAHQHTTPAHTHDLTYGMFEETMPGSTKLTTRVYRWTGSVWSQLAVLTDITDAVAEVDLTDYIDAPGKYRISVRSGASTPNSGRLGADVAGHVVGLLQPRGG